MKKSRKDEKSLLTNYLMVVLLKIWVTLPFSVRIGTVNLCAKLPI